MLLKRLLKLGGMALSALLIGAVALWILAIGSEQHRSIFYKDVTAQSSTPEPRLLKRAFQEMALANVLQLDTDTFQVTLPSCDEPYAPEIDPDSGIDRNDAIRLQRISCRALFRNEVRSEVESWNNSLSEVSVRDAASLSNNADLETMVQPALLRPSEWTASRPSQIDSVSYPVSVSNASGPSPDVYGFAVCGASTKGFSDWLTLRSESVDLRRSLSPGRHTIQVAGARSLLFPKDQPGIRILEQSRKCIKHQVGEDGRIQYARNCRLASSKACDADSPRIDTIIVEVTEAAEFQASAVGSPSLPAELLPFKGAMIGRPEPGTDLAQEAYVRTRVGDSFLSINCVWNSGAPYCWLDWFDALRKKPADDEPVELTLENPTDSQGFTLTDEDGRLTIAAEERYGLSGVIGVGPPDYTSVSSRVSSSLGRQTTIDARMQALSWVVLNEALGPGPGLTRITSGNPEPISGISAADELNSDYEKLRSAALVIMEVDDRNQAGAIRAAVSWPKLEPGFHSWDIAALRSWDQDVSPLQPVAWSSLKFPQAPGSTFKIVSGLAGIQAYLDGGRNLDLRQLLVGADDLNTQALMGIPCSSTELRLPNPEGERGKDSFFTVNNALGEIENACYGGGYIDQCNQWREGAGGGVGLQHGLCEAVTISNNIWFAQLMAKTHFGLVPEGTSLNRQTDAQQLALCASPLSGSQFENMPLKRVTEALGWGQGLDLITGDANTFRSGITFAAGPILDGIRPNTATCKSVALNAYGQAAQASPLTMASFAAGLARTDLTPPTPFLYGSRSRQRIGRPLLDYSPAQSAEANQLVEAIRVGMNAVVNDSYGTSKTAFCLNRGGDSLTGRCPAMVNLRPGVFAKTGTATIIDDEKNPVYSSWLVGWVDPTLRSPISPGDLVLAPQPESARGEIRSRLAFSCMVTHTATSDGYGGGVCGPMIARLLLDIDQGVEVVAE